MKKNLKNVKCGIWIPYRLLFRLDMQFNTFMATYMLIYSYTHKSENDWFEGGLNFITEKINAKSPTSARDAVKLLEEEGLIVSRTRKTARHTYKDYRINKQYLIDEGIFDFEDDVQEEENYNLPEFIPDEPDSVCDMTGMDFPEPIQPKPKFEPEPVQLYGECQNVRLTESEYRKLDEQFGTLFTETTLKRFSEYVFTTNKYTTANFRSHSDVLKVWCSEDKVKAEKSAEKNYNQNLSKICSESDTSNISNKSIYKKSYNSLSQSAESKKNGCSDKMEFCEVLKKIGSVFAESNVKSEDDFKQLDYIARQADKCVIPAEFVGKPRAMKSALKFMFADSYNRKSGVYSVALMESANGFIQALSELASADFTVIRKQKVYGIDVIEKINQMFSDNCQMPYVKLENFMKFYAKKVSGTTVHSRKAFMKAIWWDYLDNDVQIAHAFSELCYPAEKFSDDYGGFLNTI